VLSACETAVGDDRASLGLAGIAVKSGAHSVMASLWAVDDSATQKLIQEFYTGIVTTGGQSKARALQLAQQKVMANPEWHHPQYWAPFTVIGNWLDPKQRAEIYTRIEKDRKAELEAEKAKATAAR
jgi:CHAT domain-containing protein